MVNLLHVLRSLCIGFTLCLRLALFTIVCKIKRQSEKKTEYTRIKIIDEKKSCNEPVRIRANQMYNSSTITAFCCCCCAAFSYISFPFIFLCVQVVIVVCMCFLFVFVVTVFLLEIAALFYIFLFFSRCRFPPSNSVDEYVCMCSVSAVRAHHMLCSTIFIAFFGRIRIVQPVTV